MPKQAAIMSPPVEKTVQARDFWSNTGIRLMKGRHYDFLAIGRWFDWFIDCDADGYRSALTAPLQGLRRAPAQNWFQLMGSIDRRNDLIFPIGTHLANYQAPADGELTCFANDLIWMYWNNYGSISLWVIPLS